MRCRYPKSDLGQGGAATAAVPSPRSGEMENRSKSRRVELDESIEGALSRKRDHHYLFRTLAQECCDASFDIQMFKLTFQAYS